jgi:hypothetical protein
MISRKQGLPCSKPSTRPLQPPTPCYTPKTNYHLQLSVQATESGTPLSALASGWSAICGADSYTHSTTSYLACQHKTTPHRGSVINLNRRVSRDAEVLQLAVAGW